VAGDNKIKISADTSAIKKSLMDLSKDVKELGKSKVAIFDKDQKDFLTKEASKHMKNIGKEIDNNNQRIVATTKLLNKEGRTLKQNLKTRQALTNMMKKQVGLQKEMHKLNDMKTNIGGGGKGGIFGKLKGMGGKGGSMLGMGGMARMLGPLGLALGVGGFAMSRAKKANNTFEGGIGGRMALRGRGVGDMNLNDKEGAAGAGLNADSMRRARLQSMDVFGQAASTQQAVTQRSAFEKNFGIEQGTVSQLGQGVSETLGGEASNKAMIQMQASLIASGISDEIGPYLETAASMLTTINEKGISFNDSAMGLLADLAGQDGVAAERAGRLATGVDASIRGSSGEANSFFQQSFASSGMLSGAGNSLGGIQAAIRSGGLFGANTDADPLLSKGDKSMFKKTGIGGQNMQNRAGGILGKLDDIYGSEEDNSKLPETQRHKKRLARLNFVRQTFGLQSEVEAANVEQLLKSARDGSASQDQVQKEFDKIQKGSSELGNLQIMNKSMEGQTQILKDIHQAVLDEAGEQLAPVFIGIDRTMMKLDATLSAMMSFFGITTDQEKVDEATKGLDDVSKEEYDQITMGNKGLEKKFKSNLRDSYMANEKEMSEMGDTPFASPRTQPWKHAQWEKKQKLMEKSKNFKKTSSNLGIPLTEDKNMGTGQYVQQNAPGLGTPDFGKQISSMMEGVNKQAPASSKNDPLLQAINESNDLLKKNAKANEVTAKNSKAKGNAPLKVE
tara:strand:+ start:26471 stop:28663 length:2193 start_codon:yes stop_codon:yes gene_type:complete